MNFQNVSTAKPEPNEFDTTGRDTLLQNNKNSPLQNNQLQKCTAPFNFSDESVNKVGKKENDHFWIFKRVIEIVQNSTHISLWVSSGNNLI